jgi:small-conductance mechanosensitive channel
MGALKSLRDLAEAAEARIDVLREQVAAASDEVRKAELESSLASERQRLRELEKDFREVASGVEETEYTMEDTATPGLTEQVGELLQPLLGEMRDASTGPREMEALRSQLRKARQRQDMAREALNRIRSLEATQEDPAMRELLAESRGVWQQRAGESGSRVKVLELQLAERERERTPFLEKASHGFSNFWKTRGLNLLLAAGAVLAVFFLGRWLIRVLHRVSPLHRRKGPQLGKRLVDLISTAVLAVSCLLAALIVLYVREDWVLFTLAVVVLLALAWAGRNTLPPYIDQIRLILNLGPVREGERIVIGGLPWRVGKLGFYSELTNPELEGGTLRLPADDLTDLRSRPWHPREPWFPTRADDWVILADGTFGKVLQQTPEQIVLVRRGGSLKTYATADFIEQRPENLSRDFRIRTLFGIDYSHQAESTGSIPERLEAAVEAALVAEVGREQVRRVRVELAAAGASSLDYAVLVDLSGEVAARYNALTRLLVRTCVDTCNAEGWVIPFTQVTVHQAGE